MADYCKQCYTEILGMPEHADQNDLRGLITERQYLDGFVATALCEGCGGGEFTPDGTCLGGCEVHPVLQSPIVRTVHPEDYLDHLDNLAVAWHCGLTGGDTTGYDRAIMLIEKETRDA